ncbi:hypothetical protein OROHE_026776 [Orobanche hederae]
MQTKPGSALVLWDVMRVVCWILDFESLLCGNPPYIGSRAEEPSKQTPAATVRPKKKTKYLHQKVLKPVEAY